MIHQNPAHIIVIIVISFILAGCSLSGSSQPAADIPGDVPKSAKAIDRHDADFRFVVVGDRTGGHRPGIFDRAMDQVNYLQPEFVMGVGDLIEGYTEDLAQLDHEWSEVERMIAKLDAPFFYVVGNHDMGNNVMTKVWAERRGSAYYHFVYRDVLFIGLNTEDPFVVMDEETKNGMEEYKQLLKTDPDAANNIVKKFEEENGEPLNMQAILPVNMSDEQVAYVQGALDQNPDARWTMLFMHKPAWLYNNENFKKIESALQGRPYTMIAGHHHYYTYEQRYGRDYISMGKTGGSTSHPGPGDMDHIAWVTMTDEGPVFANIELGGLHDKKGKQP